MPGSIELRRVKARRALRRAATGLAVEWAEEILRVRRPLLAATPAYSLQEEPRGSAAHRSAGRTLCPRRSGPDSDSKDAPPAERYSRCACGATETAEVRFSPFPLRLVAAALTLQLTEMPRSENGKRKAKSKERPSLQRPFFAVRLHQDCTEACTRAVRFDGDQVLIFRGAG